MITVAVDPRSCLFVFGGEAFDQGFMTSSNVLYNLMYTSHKKQRFWGKVEEVQEPLLARKEGY